MMDSSSLTAGAAVITFVIVVLVYVLRPKASSGGSSHAEAFESTKLQTEKGCVADEHPAGELTIFFGSQTGTAEGFAMDLANEGKTQGFDAKAVDLEDFEPEAMLACKRAVFVMATYGEGDPTDSAVNFITWIKNADDELESCALKGLEYTVFGLGNKEYEFYNSTAKQTDKHLDKLGAKRVFELGLGDDSAALEDDFESWKEPMWTQLVNLYHPDAGVKDDENTDAKEVLMPRAVPFEVVYLEDGDTTPICRADDVAPSSKHYLTASTYKVVENRELRKNDPGSTRHIDLELATSLSGTNGPIYTTADNLAVLPHNDEEQVRALAEHLKYTMNARFTLKAELKTPLPFPTPCSVSTALTCFCDINGIPRRSLLKDLVPFCKDRAQRDAICRLSSKEGRDEYRAVIEEKGRSLFDILVHDFPSCEVPLAHFLCLVPRLQPRYYTISSSSMMHPHRIGITVSVIHETKEDTGVFKGVCSNHLQQLMPPETLNGKRVKDEATKKEKRRPWPQCKAFLRPSSFRLPANPETPIVLIGPGTGIAPMRALLQERAKLREGGVSTGPSILYFGCKNREMDYIYEDELMAFKESGVLTSLHLAFSRETTKKVYVQHLLAEHAADMWKLVKDQEAYVYVCGGTAMGNDVGKVFVDIFQSQGSLEVSESEAYLSDLKAKGRYVQELWA